MNASTPDDKKRHNEDGDDTISPAYQTTPDAPAEGARNADDYADNATTGENDQQAAELSTGDDPAEGAPESSTDERLEEVKDFPQGATEEMTVRSDEAGDMPDDKVNAMDLPDDAMPSEVAPSVGASDSKEGDVPTQDNTGGRWNVDTIAPAPPETEDIQEAFNPTSQPDQPHSEVY
jgi:hypothetical protein